MIPYWIILFIPVWWAIHTNRPFKYSSEHWPNQWKMMFVILSLMVGLRHDVGADWINYLRYIDEVAYKAPLQVILGEDPAYAILNWIASRMGWGVYFVNMISAFVFSFGVIAFCRKQPRSWLALTVAMPYLVIVVAMGYTRQGVAIGFALLALVGLADRKIFRFAILIVIAAAFHKSAVLLMPMAVFSPVRNRWFKLVGIVFISVLLYGIFLQEHVETIRQNYIEAEYQSSGAFVRIMMNAVPAGLFLFNRHKFRLSREEQQFWTWMSVISLGFVWLYYLSSSSTAVDRVALYMIPLQLFVFSRIPEVFGKVTGEGNSGWVMAVIAYSASVLYVWLNFADNAFAWLPYQFYPWVLFTK